MTLRDWAQRVDDVRVGLSPAARALILARMPEIVASATGMPHTELSNFMHLLRNMQVDEVAADDDGSDLI